MKSKLILHGGLLVVGLVWAVPFFWMVFTVFAPPALGGSPGEGALEVFHRVFDSAPFARYFLNSLLVVVGILGVQFVTMTLAAYAFARLRFWGKNVIFLILVVQIVVPNEVLLVSNYQTIVSLGLVNTLPGIMAPFLGSAFGIFLLRQSFRSIPKDFDEAATIDGCGLGRKLWHVYVPLAKPAYLAFALVSVSTHWNDFLWPLIVTNSDEVRPVTVGLASFATTFETGARWNEVSAATLLVSAPLVVGFLAFQKKFTASFSHSAGLK